MHTWYYALTLAYNELYAMLYFSYVTVGHFGNVHNMYVNTHFQEKWYIHC